MKNRKLYVFDLDGTLADLRHRLHYILDPLRNDNSDQIIKEGPAFVREHQNWKPNWDAFFEASYDDVPIRWVVDLLRMIHGKGNSVLILSGRSDKVRTQTTEWLNNHRIPFDFLEMRPEGCRTPDEVLKPLMLSKWLEEQKVLRKINYHVEFIVDDRQKVADAWRNEGYNVLQCNKWDEPSKGRVS